MSERKSIDERVDEFMRFYRGWTKGLSGTRFLFNQFRRHLEEAVAEAREEERERLMGKGKIGDDGFPVSPCPGE